MTMFTIEEAKKKVCIHVRKITDDGLCAADGCMNWIQNSVTEVVNKKERQAAIEKVEQEVKERTEEFKQKKKDIALKREELWEKTHSVTDLNIFDIENMVETPFAEKFEKDLRDKLMKQIPKEVFKTRLSMKGCCRLCK